MLARNSYSAEHVAACRADVDAALAVWRAVADTLPADGTAAADLEARYFNAHVVALEQAFVHRTRGLEGKDGNPLNEVRLIAAALVTHGGRMTVESPIRWRPERAVLGHREGDVIAVRAEDYRRLAVAFLDTVEQRLLTPAPTG